VLGYRPSDEEIAARRPSAERRFLMEWVGEERVEECHDALCRHYAELHRALGEGMYEGVREMLAALRAARYPLGVVTGKGRRVWEVTERTLELGRWEVVVTEDEVEHPKPHPGGLLAAAAALGMDSRAVAYIGDSAGDLEAGRAAGMRVGAALWPKTAPGERERFEAEVSPLRPDWLFARPADVVRAFAGWC
jgi:HAD superfamily hydrolase (TIGR01549 family)